MEGSGISFSSPSSTLSTLLCQEDQSCFDHEDGELGSATQFIDRDDSGCDEDYIKFLVRKEKATDLGSNSSSGLSSKTPDSWLIDARLDAVDWVFNTQTHLGIRSQTAYLSLTYFDRFLSMHPIQEDQSWVVKALSIACLSLAVKMGESKGFQLSQYTTQKGYDGINSKVIQKMELLVLGILNWNMRQITPFPYLHYFSNKFGVHGTKFDHVISTAVELLMCVIKGINLIEYRPSIIAAAAVLAATDWQLTQEALKCKVSTVSLWESETPENQEQFFLCYSLMQRLSAKGNLSTPNSSEVDLTLSANTTTKAGTKRRLMFNSDSDDDEGPSLEEKNQQR